MNHYKYIRAGSGLAAAAVLLIGGVAMAQSVTGLQVQAMTASSVPAGSSQISLMDMSFMASSTGSVSISSIPITTSFNGVSPSEFTNCSIENSATLGTPLNTGANAVASLSAGSTFHLDSPTIVPSGTTVHLALVCSVDPITPVGGSIMLSLTPSSISATDQSGVTVVPVGTLASDGSSMSTSGQITITAAGAGAPAQTTTPDAPNTGAGGNAPATELILALSFSAALAGLIAARKMRTR